MTVTLHELTDGNHAAVLALRVAPAQERFVSTVRDSLRHAAEEPDENPWFRAVHDDGEPAGFVMVSWNAGGEWTLWKLLIDERRQGRGRGAEAVRQVAALVRADGGTSLLTSYVPGDGGPAGFYERLGFVPTGDVDPDGEVIARLALP